MPRDDHEDLKGRRPRVKYTSPTSPKSPKLTKPVPEPLTELERILRQATISFGEKYAADGKTIEAFTATVEIDGCAFDDARPREFTAANGRVRNADDLRDLLGVVANFVPGSAPPIADAIAMRGLLSRLHALHTARKQGLASELRNLASEVARALGRIETDDHINPHLIANYAMLTEQIAQWNLVRDLLPFFAAEVTP